jgi:hypothetical protein
MARNGKGRSLEAISTLGLGLLGLFGAGCSGQGGIVPTPPFVEEKKSRDLVEQVRKRLPQLKPGMTEEQVKQVLADLPLGQETVVSRTISGGREMRYQLSSRRFLELSYIPNSLNDPPPGRLVKASITE